MVYESGSCKSIGANKLLLAGFLSHDQIHLKDAMLLVKFMYDISSGDANGDDVDDDEFVISSSSVCHQHIIIKSSAHRQLIISSLSIHHKFIIICSSVHTLKPYTFNVSFAPLYVV